MEAPHKFPSFKVSPVDLAKLCESDRRRLFELWIWLQPKMKAAAPISPRRPHRFDEEISAIIAFTNQPTPGRGARCLAAGVACQGPHVCVNTNRLKHFIGRCKSSINYGFQQLGYDVVRNRSEAFDSLCAIVPEMRSDPASFRQWTVRCATEMNRWCFVSPHIQPLPGSDSDLHPPSGEEDVAVTHKKS
jgi:hypothetical protein